MAYTYLMPTEIPLDFFNKICVFYKKFTEDHGRKPVGECLRLSKCLLSTTGVNPWVSIEHDYRRLPQYLVGFH